MPSMERGPVSKLKLLLVENCEVESISFGAERFEYSWAEAFTPKSTIAFCIATLFALEERLA
ncbi:hypothetical protein NUITMVS1_22020 [Shewanella xiamenensis]|nr:hypothetical protein NUITMVS1_22020 [Shewanella xiamenensis]